MRTPAPDKPSTIFLGRARTSGSRNSKKIRSITANQPALPASPAAFWSNCKIHGRLCTSHPFAVMTRSAPIMPPQRSQPTEPLSVRSKKRMSTIGANTMIKLSASWNSRRISSVIIPIAWIFCFRDWKTTDRNKQKK